MYNIIQLNDKNLSELQQIAKELGLKKVDSLKKEELVYRILDEQAIVGATKKVAAQQNNEERMEGQRNTENHLKGLIASRFDIIDKLGKTYYERENHK